MIRVQDDSKQMLPPHHDIDGSFFLPQPLFRRGLIAIAFCAVTIAVVHVAIFYTLKRFKYTASNSNSSSESSLSSSSSQSQQSQNQNGKHHHGHQGHKQGCMKASYQLTNSLANLCFGLYGTYVCLFNQHSDNVLFTKIYDTRSDALEHIMGYEQYYIFGAMQVGYNLWSLPVGILYVNESLPMIAHHAAVLVICILTATSHYGFRLHAPFLLGIFEISSVPLSLMNYLKDHKEWSEKHAKYILQGARISFAVLFLMVRILLGTPHAVQCIRGSYAVMTGNGDMAWYLRGWVGLVWAGEVMLLVLQMYWAWLIVKGIGRAVMSTKKNVVSLGKKKTI